MTNQIQISKTAKYVTYGNPETATTILFALHGYGQLVEFFIRKFHMLNSDNIFIVAPEGLHRFYLKGSSGRVGASWMTKEERDYDIKDYVAYLDQIWNKINSKHTFDKRVLLGFSQGGATASRWHSLGKYNAHQFILWAAVFPEDMTNDNLLDYHKSINYFVVGKQDEYYSEDKIDEHFQTLESKNVEFNLIKFEGNHNIHPETLLNLM
jgi:predicted esterase